jgi:predicted dithiol-disulfide oxidoreductase (DUF899 family)
MSEAAQPLHEIRFPHESADYRVARDELLVAELALRRQIEAVAAKRRALPPGGAIAEDYEFEEVPYEEGRSARRVRFSELFGNKETLIAYSLMYGPDMAEPCPSCTSILDGLNGQAPHVAERASLVVIAKSPAPRIRAHARARGWDKLRLFSSAGTTYNRDYHGENAKGSQRPALNVFTRRDDTIRHVTCSELMFVAPEPGQDPRHVDLIWPLWNLLDATPEGRGSDWRPKLGYG